MVRRNTPSHVRISLPSSLRVTERDFQMFLSTYEYHVLTAHQIEVLHFASSKDTTRSLRAACQRRLQKAYHYAFLDRIQRPMILGEGRNVFAYTLDTHGANLIAERLGIDRATLGWKPKYNRLGPMFLEHLLMINNVRVVMQLLKSRTLFSKVIWIDELALKSNEYQGKMPTYRQAGRITRIFPDGFVSIWMPNHEHPASFFLEVDQGTMQNSLWQNKIEAYRDYRMNGLSYQHFGTKNFRVLAIVNSLRRLQNLKKTTEKVEGSSFVWFTTSEQIDIWHPTNFLESIWHISGYEGVQPLF